MKTRRPHPIRLAVFMLIGAAFGALFSPAIAGNGANPKMAVLHIWFMVYIVSAALAGGVVEIVVRVWQRD